MNKAGIVLKNHLQNPVGVLRRSKHTNLSSYWEVPYEEGSRRLAWVGRRTPLTSIRWIQFSAELRIVFCVTVWALSKRATPKQATHAFLFIDHDEVLW